ncbi:MAG: hypothetical protein OEX22_03290, partial [Cyclobacteriaceae bacterium]|nr:hypothetical protein [Cyclobacteriaceae bacterium]
HGHFFTPLSNHIELILGILITTIAWVTVTLLTKPTDQSVLVSFYSLVKPYGRGWNKFKKMATDQGVTLPKGHDNFTKDLLSMFLGIVIVYFALFATGFFIYGKNMTAYILSAIVAVCVFLLIKLWRNKKQADVA